MTLIRILRLCKEFSDQLFDQNKTTEMFRRLFHTASCNLAGHSKWANIRHIKAAKDGQKSVQFARYSRQIRLAIQGQDLDFLDH